MADRLHYHAEDVMQMLDVGQTNAYKIIKELNDELRAQGKYTLRGKVNKNYFHLRFDISIETRIEKGKKVKYVI